MVMLLEEMANNMQTLSISLTYIVIEILNKVIALVFFKWVQVCHSIIISSYFGLLY